MNITRIEKPIIGNNYWSIIKVVNKSSVSFKVLRVRLESFKIEVNRYHTESWNTFICIISYKIDGRELSQTLEHDPMGFGEERLGLFVSKEEAMYELKRCVCDIEYWVGAERMRFPNYLTFSKQ